MFYIPQNACGRNCSLETGLVNANFATPFLHFPQKWINLENASWGRGTLSSQRQPGLNRTWKRIISRSHTIRIHLFSSQLGRRGSHLQVSRQAAAVESKWGRGATHQTSHWRVSNSERPLRYIKKYLNMLWCLRGHAMFLYLRRLDEVSAGANTPTTLLFK